MPNSPNKPRGIESHSKPKLVSTPKLQLDHTRHQTGRAALMSELRRRRAPSVKLQPLFRAAVRQTGESRDIADIRRQLSIMANTHTNVRQHVD